MSKQLASQIDKVLALADSNHDGEAVVAVRKAREMLMREGLSFGDLARAASQQKPRMSFPLGFFSGQHIVNLEKEITELRQEVEDLRTEKEAQEAYVDMWRERYVELELKFNASQSEAVRWRQLARETVDKLWDMGQAIQKDEPAATPAKKSAKTA